MSTNFIGFTVFSGISILAVALLTWHNDRIVALEDRGYAWLCDRLGYIIAKVILIYRRKRIDRALKNIEKAIQKLDKEESVIEKIMNRRYRNANKSDS